jgi:hypothetical protein
MKLLNMLVVFLQMLELLFIALTSIFAISSYIERDYIKEFADMYTFLAISGIALASCCMIGRIIGLVGVHYQLRKIIFVVGIFVIIFLLFKLFLEHLNYTLLITTSVVRWLTCAPRVRHIVCSIPDRFKTKTKKLVCVASSLSTHHSGEIAKTGWLGIRIMCPSMRDMYITDCGIGELAL